MKIVEIFDIKELEQLEIDCFEQGVYSLKVIEDMKNSNLYKFYFLELENKKIGYIILMDNGVELEILKIAILSEYRGKKYGKLLLDRIFQLKKDIFLEVRESNVVAIKFYIENGFEKIGLRKNYYSNGENAVLMGKFL